METGPASRSLLKRFDHVPDAVAAPALIALYGAYYLAPSVALSVLILLVCAALSVARLELAVALTPLAMPFYMFPKHVGHTEFSLGETAIVIAAAACVLQLVFATITKKQTLLPISLLMPAWKPLVLCVLFLLAATVATLHAFERHEALRQYRVAIVEPLIYGALVLYILRDVRSQRRLILACCAAGLVVGLLGIGQYIFRPEALTGVLFSGSSAAPIASHLNLVSSVYGSPDNLALLLDRCIPLVLALLWWTLAGENARETRTRVLAGVLMGITAAMAVALLLTGSRGGLIVAAIVSVAVVALVRTRGQQYRRRRAIGVSAGVSAMAVALILWKIRHGLSNATRFQVWQSALHMIKDHPLFGIGPDNFLYYYFNPAIALDPRHPLASTCTGSVTLPAKHYESALAWQEPCLSHPHNILLDLWLSTGIVGLLAGVLLLLWATKELWRTWLSDRRDTALIGLAGLVIVASTVLHGLVDNSLFLPDLGVMFWLAIGLALGMRIHGSGVEDALQADNIQGDIS